MLAAPAPFLVSPAVAKAFFLGETRWLLGFVC